ncbi:MAG: DUF4296 domain-containing protein [Flavobacteriia bacterium]|nr:DUF4296 domain-containing protein [Flavobacteriia bacterium]
MKKVCIIFLLFFGLFSCYEKEQLPNPPNNLIPRNKFVLIMEELMLIEHQSQVEFPNFQEFYPTLDTSAFVLMKKYQTTIKDFEKSFDYYSFDPSQMKEIYNDVLENMTKKLNQSNLNNKKLH